MSDATVAAALLLFACLPLAAQNKADQGQCFAPGGCSTVAQAGPTAATIQWSIDTPDAPPAGLACPEGSHFHSASVTYATMPPIVGDGKCHSNAEDWKTVRLVKASPSPQSAPVPSGDIVTISSDGGASAMLFDGSQCLIMGTDGTLHAGPCPKITDQSIGLIDPANSLLKQAAMDVATAHADLLACKSRRDAACRVERLARELAIEKLLRAALKRAGIE